MTSPLRDLLPSQIAVSSRRNEVSEATLLPDELVFAAGSVPRRKAEFATGRQCARSALAMLGIEGAHRTPISVGTHRQPVWPPGVVGSITHCDGFFAAAVAASSQVDALGVDVEVHKSIPDAVVEATSWPEEILALPLAAKVAWPTVLFSAREAIFKAWYPKVGQWLGHHDVRISIDVATGGLDIAFLGASADLAEQFQLTALEGAVSWNEYHVFSAVWLANPQL